MVLLKNLTKILGVFGLFFWVFIPMVTANASSDVIKFDKFDIELEATFLGNKEYYDPNVNCYQEDIIITWLEHVPKKGSNVWYGILHDGNMLLEKKVTPCASWHSNPQLAVDSENKIWLTYEFKNETTQLWDISVNRLHKNGTILKTITLHTPENDINHRSVGALNGGVWITWMADTQGQWDILLAKCELDGRGIHLSKINNVSRTPHGDWLPDLCVQGNGDLFIAWDSYTGESYDVLCRWLINGEFGPIYQVASGPEFQGYVRTACDGKGRTYILWEEGAINWGHYYAGNAKDWNNIRDDYGPLHRFRKMNLMEINQKGELFHLKEKCPQPAFKVTDKGLLRPGVEKLGKFYEKGRLSAGPQGRVWIVYKHFVHTQCGQKDATMHHVYKGFGIYARFLDADGWSSAYSSELRQGDGSQAIDLLAHRKGACIAWSIGRTDRRKNNEERGLVFADVILPHQSPGPPARGKKVLLKEFTVLPIDKRDNIVSDQFILLTGDLHRHTDLSLCFPFYDGTYVDAYRYGTDVAQLDFLGITDHTRDLDQANNNSQVWQRCLQAADRYRLKNRFVPLISYEWSQRGTDHNVFTLDKYPLFSHKVKIGELWNGLSTDSLTICHAPVLKDLFHSSNEEMRPLYEIYQGFRNEYSLSDSYQKAISALDQGQHIGFVAGSDHLATQNGFTYIWSNGKTRVAILEALKDRRAYASVNNSTKLVFRTENHWMGDTVLSSTNSIPHFIIKVEAEAEFSEIVFVVDGKVGATLPFLNPIKLYETKILPNPRSLSAGNEHYFFVIIKHSNGHSTWSSPIWVKIDKPKVESPPFKSEKDLSTSHILQSAIWLAPAPLLTKDSGNMSPALVPMAVDGGLNRRNIFFGNGPFSDGNGQYVHRISERKPGRQQKMNRPEKTGSRQECEQECP